MIQDTEGNALTDFSQGGPGYIKLTDGGRQDVSNAGLHQERGDFPDFCYRDPSGLVRNRATGLVWSPADAVQISSEQAKRDYQEAHAAEQKAIQEQMHRGLPPGFFRDPNGLVRSVINQGKYAGGMQDWERGPT